MANTIITKNSSTADAVPTAVDLVTGELAVNVTDKRLFTENASGTIVELGTNPSELNFKDNAKANFGNSSDLQIYHDNTATYGENASVIVDAGSGPLKLVGGQGGRIELVNADGDVMLQATGQGAVKLYYDDSTKLATTNTGIEVTGTVVTDGLGIGTDSPSTLLEIKEQGDATIRLNYGGINSNDGEDYYGGVEFFADGSNYSRPVVSAYMRAIHTREGTGHSNSDSGLVFGTSTSSANATAVERMRIEANSGAVLIGGTNTSSAHGLDTDGSLFLQSQTNNANIGLSIYVNESSQNRRASFFVDDQLGVYGVESTATSGVPDFVIRRASSEVARFTSTGLAFGGDTADDNSLNDYEKGNFTPAVQDSSGNTATVTTAYGYYVKIGLSCTIWIQVTNIDTTGLAAGDDIRVTGLPFAGRSVTGSIYMYGSGTIANCSSTNVISPAILDNTQYIRFRERIPSNVDDNITVSELTSGTSDIWATITYYTAD